MHSALDFYWLPKRDDWGAALKAVGRDSLVAWPQLVALARHRLDFLEVNRLDAVANSVLNGFDGDLPAIGTFRLAILSSSTTAHLLAPIRVAGLRRGFRIDIYECAYGQYVQELYDPSSGLFAFRPTAVLFALDAYHLATGIAPGDDQQTIDAALSEVAGRLQDCWTRARDSFQCPILQQAVLPLFAGNLGSNDHRLAGSRAQFVTALNAFLRAHADTYGVDIVAVDAVAMQSGVRTWHDPVMWHRAKQEICGQAALVYGELVVRVLAARAGRSAKALILDLDNTLWGGVIGDDGLDGIVLGQGSAFGEAFVAFQAYAKGLAARGIILAVCSKNDEANALAPFESHPEMVLRKGEIACFVANWNDKAANIRAIAKDLNIGLDACVFVDDNPFERNFVRQALPMVEVPEMPDDVAFYADCIADAGYFEAVSVTSDDLQRTAAYVGNRERATFQAQTSSLDDYLRGLRMQLSWRKFDKLNLARIVQLINKTNQFNLTTRRYTEADVAKIMSDEAHAFGLQLRLVDRFGDNGIIAIVIGRRAEGEDVAIDTWLMSCRVLGRNVEETTLNLIVEHAKKIGGARLIGEFIPTSKNAMVKDHYKKLGFASVENHEDGRHRASLDLDQFSPRSTHIELCEE